MDDRHCREDSAIGGSVRGFALFHRRRRTELRAYIEAPLAPIIYMRELYKAVPKPRHVSFRLSNGFHVGPEFVVSVSKRSAE